jgi:hypothetical protein
LSIRDHEYGASLDLQQLYPFRMKFRFVEVGSVEAENPAHTDTADDRIDVGAAVRRRTPHELAHRIGSVNTAPMAFDFGYGIYEVLGIGSTSDGATHETFCQCVCNAPNRRLHVPATRPCPIGARGILS